jgi:hypothetical protein
MTMASLFNDGDVGIEDLQALPNGRGQAFGRNIAIGTATAVVRVTIVGIDQTGAAAELSH